MRHAILAALLLLFTTASSFAAPLTIVAAENVYGEMAKEIAGSRATVVSILSNPDQDPHLFEADAATARALADARVVIVNGADYDPWMDKLLAASPSASRIAVVVAALAGKKSGDNPHLWYDPAIMRLAAAKVGDALAVADPAGAAEYAAGVARFTASLQPLESAVGAAKTRFAGTPVTASEPVFGYMATALGLTMRNEAFQTAVMNNTEPGPADVAAFENDLRHHKVRLMITNSQADDAAVRRLADIAHAAKVPVVSVSETEPANTTYAGWMLRQVNAVTQALRAGNS